jgi:hypothetical protein
MRIDIHVVEDTDRHTRQALADAQEAMLVDDYSKALAMLRIALAWADVERPSARTYIMWMIDGTRPP